MGYWLARERTVQTEDVLTRFDPRFWTVNFPRPMMASVVSTAADALRVDALFYRADDLAGLIWESEDRHDHPLLGYATRRDYRECRLRFRWRSGGVVPLDAVHGPVLTIEGRDASGEPRSWYVRLWNHAVGSAEDAVVEIDFATVTGGFELPAEADPVWAGDVDRMFVSLVAPGYSGADALLPAPAEGWVELSEIACEGPDPVLAIGSVIVPEHGLSIASGYDDSYHLTPARLLRNALHLGYRGNIVHYVGMSHYFRLEADGGGLYASRAGGALNPPCRAWHRHFAAEAKALGYGVIWSLSYELLDQHCWSDWKQRASDGSPALTGWEPPSALLSPAHGGAMAYLKAVAGAFVQLAIEVGLPVRFQVGEPWWWVMPDGRPCLYDAAARAALDPIPIATVRAPLDAEQTLLLDRAGAVLAASTAALTTAVRELAPEAETLLLAYLPTVLDVAAPELKRANLPIGWAWPAFDVLQLEDYDWAAAGNVAATARGIAAAEARLGYSARRQQYFAGFVLRPEDAGQWQAIESAAEVARKRGVAATFIWALPQVIRDGFVHFDDGEDAMQAFDDVCFPLALGREAEVAPEMSTAIVTSAGGVEKRNADWAEARTRYDEGPGVRSEADIAILLGFYRARMGPARAFRLTDPFDNASGEPVSATDQPVGIGDGVATRFPLIKRYDDVARRITRPVPGSVRVAVDGVETQGFSLEPGGVVAVDVAPPPGAEISTGFRFDVPVRFAEDRLVVNRATFLAGAAPSVPLVEVREA
ncbi:phage distal tail protein, Rcc01695 family [Sphingomonas sp. 3-13AW]|uniref:phage distal tail protein, Rcc01695 family n=1 Tax=Sphingomonas sp. 3-13AW TaxID=3050450 RepID=UPI003BB56E2D